MRLPPRISEPLWDRITDQAREARQEDTALTSRALRRTGVPNARLWRVGVEDIKGRALGWLARPSRRARLRSAQSTEWSCHRSQQPRELARMCCATAARPSTQRSPPPLRLP